MARALAAERSSLGVDTGQSIVLSTQFLGYGFGLWDAGDQLIATAISIVVKTGLILAPTLWRRRFALGPFQ